MRYQNISGQAIQVMVVQKRKKELILVPSNEEFESDRETVHIRNMMAQKLVRRVNDS